jgi:membrane protein YdbS with pleckstrin-like domain
MKKAAKQSVNKNKMKINKLAFMLAIAAGVICLGNFIYQYVKFNKTDYTILLAGVFIAAMGATAYLRQKK